MPAKTEAHDPLALRHGALVSQAWQLLEEARQAARRDPVSAARTQLRRLRHVRNRVLAAHRDAMQYSDLGAATVDGWFAPIEDGLMKAEAFFKSQKQAAAMRGHLPYAPNGTLNPPTP